MKKEKKNKPGILCLVEVLKSTLFHTNCLIIKIHTYLDGNK